MISVYGLFRSGYWLKSLIFLLVCDGRRVLMTWVLVVSLILNFLFFMRNGREREVSAAVF